MKTHRQRRFESHYIDTHDMHEGEGSYTELITGKQNELNFTF